MSTYLKYAAWYKHTIFINLKANQKRKKHSEQKHCLCQVYMINRVTGHFMNVRFLRNIYLFLPLDLGISSPQLSIRTSANGLLAASVFWFSISLTTS